MAIGGFFKALGKGARAVGRGAMKGVLGFDDRDVRNKFKRAPKEEEEEVEETNPDYSGYSRGVADLGTNEPESDGVLEEADMELPPDVGVGHEEALIGLEMPDLPGFKKRKTAGVRPVQKTIVEPPKVMPSAYDMVSRPEVVPSSAPMGFSAPGASAILDTEDSRLGNMLRVASGGGPDAMARMEYEKDNPDGVNLMKVPAMLGLVTGTRTGAQVVPPGLGRGGAMPGKGQLPGKGMPKALPGRTPAQITQDPQGFSMSGGSGPMPYGRPQTSMASRQLPGRTTRPMPGPGGTSGPLEPLPPGIRNRFGKMTLVE